MSRPVRSRVRTLAVTAPGPSLAGALFAAGAVSRDVWLTCRRGSIDHLGRPFEGHVALAWIKIADRSRVLLRGEGSTAELAYEQLRLRLARLAEDLVCLRGFCALLGLAPAECSGCSMCHPDGSCARPEPCRWCGRVDCGSHCHECGAEDPFVSFGIRDCSTCAAAVRYRCELDDQAMGDASP